MSKVFIVIFALLIITQHPVNANVDLPQSISISYKIDSHYSHGRWEINYRHKGHYYVAPHSTQLHEREMQKLLKSIEESRTYTEFDATKLGITPEVIEQHRNKLAEQKKISSSYPLTDERVKTILKQRLSLQTFGTQCSMRVLIPWRWVLESKGERPGMLPWHVKSKEKEWDTFSSGLPEALAPWIDKKLGVAHLLKLNDYLQNDFWREPSLLDGPKNQVKFPK